MFEWNVRFQIPKSPINRRIAQALTIAKRRKNFHHYNNGLLITCKSYKINRGSNLITLNGPQIINGCQTVRAICEAYDGLSPDEQEHFRKNTKVQVKIIRTTEPNFIGELVISTNDQNPMNPRNLKSNTAEQRELQQRFRELSSKWFYERKDGEWAGLIHASSAIRWFRKSDYIVGKSKARVIDNEKVAKAWHSFIGYSHSALRGGISYFSDEDKKHYQLVFKSVPSPSFWSSFAQAQYTPSEEYFETGTPSVHQYLLALAIDQLVNQEKLSYKKNRDQAIERGVSGGSLKKNDQETVISSKDEVDNYLNKDDEYFVNTIVNNMRYVFVELFSFVLCTKYVSCDAITVKQLIDCIPELKSYIDENFDHSKLSGSQTGSSLLIPIYRFVKYVLMQYYYKYRAEIKATPRLKSYLAQRSTVNRLREEILNCNSSIENWDVEWKLQGKSFLESLPSI